MEMKASLIISVSANGQILLAGKPTHQITPNIFDFIVKMAKENRNIVMGYSTYAMTIGAFEDAIGDVEVVVITKNHTVPAGHKAVPSSEKALEYLKGKGLDNAIICGGTKVYNDFLDKDLATDVYLTIAPIMIGDGAQLGTSSFTKFSHADTTQVTPDTVRLHLSK